MQPHRPPLNSGRTMAVGVGVIGVVGVLTLLAVLFNGGGTGDGGTGTGAGAGSGAGSGTGSTMPTTQSLLASQPQRPMRVTIRESSYVVNGQPMDLATLTEMAAKVPEGEGPAVVVERSPTSRAKAENDLKEALGQKSIRFAMD